jgi:hypothetical protein
MVYVFSMYDLFFLFNAFFFLVFFIGIFSEKSCIHTDWSFLFIYLSPLLLLYSFEMIDSLT